MFAVKVFSSPISISSCSAVMLGFSGPTNISENSFVLSIPGFIDVIFTEIVSFPYCPK